MNSAELEQMAKDMIAFRNTMAKMEVGELFEMNFPNKRILVMRIADDAYNSGPIINPVA